MEIKKDKNEMFYEALSGFELEEALKEGCDPKELLIQQSDNGKFIEIRENFSVIDGECITPTIMDIKDEYKQIIICLYYNQYIKITEKIGKYLEKRFKKNVVLNVNPYKREYIRGHYVSPYVDGC